MKRILTTLLAAAALAAPLALPAQETTLRIAVVDLAQLVRNHPSTEKNKRELNELKEQYEKERDEKIAALETLRAEIDSLLDQVKSDALSEAGRQALRKTATDKMRVLQDDEAALRRFVEDLQRKLSSAEADRLHVTLSDIQDHLDALVAERGIGLVLDSSRSPIGGYSPVLYFDDALDITAELDERIQSSAAAAAAAAEPKPAE